MQTKALSAVRARTDSGGGPVGASCYSSSMVPFLQNASPARRGRAPRERGNSKEPAPAAADAVRWMAFKLRMMRSRQIVKKMLVHSPIKYVERMDALFRLTLLKPWIERYQPHPYFVSRESLYAHVAQTVIGDIPITYLEFGVYQGASLQSWMSLNTAENSEFVGFDSFEGLPERWVDLSRTYVPGSYSTGGRLPALEDRRVRLVRGWFQETLPIFLSQFSTDRQVVVHCDADVYVSTLFVLCKLDALMRPGTIVIFDDFSTMLHDFRAWEDYTHSFWREYEVLGASGRTYYEHVALRLTK